MKLFRMLSEKRKNPGVFKFVRCPVCHRLTLDNYYICPHCGWEYDGTETGYSSANKMTVEEYRRNYKNSNS